MIACFGMGMCLKSREMRKAAEEVEVKKLHAKKAFAGDDSPTPMQWVREHRDIILNVKTAALAEKKRAENI